MIRLARCPVQTYSLSTSFLLLLLTIPDLYANYRFAYSSGFALYPDLLLGLPSGRR
ncbi:MAG: hypothetical protein IPM37_23315 [Hahellaceae bacterium]|nr:hypothetical protein [Hahellaceae bacterium]